MSVDSAVTYTSVHSEARSWSIPSEDPYEEAARQLQEQAPNVSTRDNEAPIEAYITEVASAPPPPPSFLPSLIRPPRTRAAMAQMRAAAPSTYHPLLPSGTPPLLPIPLPAPSTSRRADIPEADTPPQKRLPTRIVTAVRAEIEWLETHGADATQWHRQDVDEITGMRHIHTVSGFWRLEHAMTNLRRYWKEMATKRNHKLLLAMAEEMQVELGMAMTAMVQDQGQHKLFANALTQNS
ncbi:hypothetical protein Tco_1016608 [Tanacetum coccineum]|uniref:Uncharacterized protein n=1 Tax=Tanacetum coccineum TaxID=301880 RepID=A0ABQ5FP53_9ASTR